MRVALRWWIPRCGQEPSCSPVRRFKRPRASPAMPRLKLTAQSDREPDTSSALASLLHSQGPESRPFPGFGVSASAGRSSTYWSVRGRFT
jgi:hypothetical protein